jgi:hypothetical protein
MTTATDTKPKLTIADSLRTKFSGQDCAVFFEVPNGTGAQKTRSADAISVEFWKSRGYAITGYEFKVSRSDWQKELAQPAKADAFFRYCDFWYLVVTDLAIVKDGELPIGWGLMLHNGTGLQIKKGATKNPDPILDRNFLCGLLRAASAGDKREYAAAIYKAEQRGRKAEEESNARVFDGLRKSLAERDAQIQKFREGFGVSLDGWEFRRGDAKKIGELVRRALNGELDPDTERMKHLRRLAKEIVESTEDFET